MAQAKKKILIIDDEENIGKMIKLNLEDDPDYEGILAMRGEAGVECVKKDKPALVLCDIMMPGMNGLETLKRIKEIAPELPVAMVTAVWDPDEARKCFEAGAYEYVTKPVDFEYLKRALFVKLFGV